MDICLREKEKNERERACRAWDIFIVILLEEKGKEPAVVCSGSDLMYMPDQIPNESFPMNPINNLEQ